MKKNTSGFTIVELLIVIVVIAILAAISIVAYTGIQQRARDSERKAELQTIAKAVEMYYAANGNYPMSSGWCTQISNTTSGYDVAFRNELSEFLPQVPYDPSYQDTPQAYFYRNIGDTSYYLYAELEGEDRADDGFSGCTRKNGTNNEYDYRIPAF